MAFAYSPKIITDGLVFAVDAANKKSYPGSGTTWIDLAGSNNGTLTNGPTFDSGNGGSIVFDGTNDSVEMGGSDTIASSITEGSWSCWFKSTQAGSIGYLASLKRSINGETPSTLFSLILNRINTSLTVSNGRLMILARNSANTDWNIVTFENNYNDGSWYNVVATASDSSLTLYVNGFQVATSTGDKSLPSITGNTRPFSIGHFDSSNNPTLSFNGNISNVSFYNKALSSTEILQNYNVLKSRFGL